MGTRVWSCILQFVQFYCADSFVLTGRYNWINKEEKYNYSVMWHPVLMLLRLSKNCPTDESATEGAADLEEIGEVLPIRASDHWSLFTASRADSKVWSQVEDPIWFAKKSESERRSFKK